MTKKDDYEDLFFEEQQLEDSTACFTEIIFNKPRPLYPWECSNNLEHSNIASGPSKKQILESFWLLQEIEFKTNNNQTLNGIITFIDFRITNQRGGNWLNLFISTLQGQVFEILYNTRSKKGDNIRLIEVFD